MIKIWKKTNLPPSRCIVIKTLIVNFTDESCVPFALFRTSLFSYNPTSNIIIEKKKKRDEIMYNKKKEKKKGVKRPPSVPYQAQTKARWKRRPNREREKGNTGHFAFIGRQVPHTMVQMNPIHTHHNPYMSNSRTHMRVDVTEGLEKRPRSLMDMPSRNSTKSAHLYASYS